MTLRESERREIMRLRPFAVTALTSIGWMCNLAGAWAQAVQVMQSQPVASAVMDGRSSEFFVRFDKPVDHIRSTLAITRDGKVVEKLTPRLESAPNVLFARTPTLAPGNYTLHWSVKTLSGEDLIDGDIPFSVGKKP
jgi:methionine-rich copper-binding protein CopC